MKRELLEKNLENARLANNYGGWMYCDSCGENIGYLCYVTYDLFDMSFHCNCGNHGSFHLKFKDSCEDTEIIKNGLELRKNRYCCGNDESALFTVLEKKLLSYNVKVSCSHCGELHQLEKGE